jgi:Tfp pilus assembly protein PilE
MSLVELMLGLLLTSIASLGAFTAWAQGRARYETTQAMGRLQERAQYVFSTLEPELQLAGYYGVHGASLLPQAIEPPSAASCGAGQATRLLAPVEASSGYALACTPQPPGAVAGSAVLTVRRASAQLSTPEAGRLQLLTSLTTPGARGLIADGRLPPDLALSPGITELRDLLVRSWYVARASDGPGDEPALRVKSLTRVAGRPRFVDTEVMPGVEGLGLQLGLRDANAPGGLRYIDAGESPLGAPVVAVRVTLHLRSSPLSRPVRHLSVTRSFTLRNAAA